MTGFHAFTIIYCIGFETRGREPPLIVNGRRKARQKWRAFCCLANDSVAALMQSVVTGHPSAAASRPAILVAASLTGLSAR